MTNSGTLIYFSNSYPFGNGYNWEKNEIAFLGTSYELLIISPFSYEGNRISKELPTGVELWKPIDGLDGYSLRISDVFLILFHSKRIYFIREFFKEQVYRKSYWFKNWLAESRKTIFLLGSSRFQHLQSLPNKEKTTLYFYWGNNQTLVVPFLSKLGFRKVVVRFHGFDLYKERLGGYQPFRQPLLNAIDSALCISENGKKYLQQHYNTSNCKVSLMRLGTNPIHQAQMSEDGIFRVISCARMIKLKRIPLLAKCLKQLDFPIEWIHIGDGEDMIKTSELVDQFPSHIKVEFPGWVPAEEVRKYYEGKRVDLFISVSETEGVPVSIMEALSAGVPVLSTDVGGISEIVDDVVGTLIPVDFDETTFVRKISEFRNMGIVEIKNMRIRAQKRFEERCDQHQCNQQLLKELIA